MAQHDGWCCFDAEGQPVAATARKNRVDVVAAATEMNEGKLLTELGWTVRRVKVEPADPPVRARGQRRRL